jgi:hypothetical protein
MTKEFAVSVLAFYHENLAMTYENFMQAYRQAT